MIDYTSIKAAEPKATWVEQKRTGTECGSIELPGRSKGRVWVDPEMSEVLRLVDGITGMVDVRSSITQQKRGGEMYLTIERDSNGIPTSSARSRCRPSRSRSTEHTQLNRH